MTWDEIYERADECGYFNEEQETFNGIRVCDIEEVDSVRLQPVWSTKDNTDGYPDVLYIYLYHHGDTDEDAIVGQYILDGTLETFTNALSNYKKVSESLLTKGYCKISDFKNVDWFLK